AKGTKGAKVTQAHGWQPVGERAPRRNVMRYLTLGEVSLILMVCASASQEPAVGTKQAAAEPVANRPKVPGKLRLRLRERRETPPGSGQIKAVERTPDRDAAATAI